MHPCHEDMFMYVNKSKDFLSCIQKKTARENGIWCALFLQTYVTSSDKDFAAATIQAIGRCASSISEVTDTCLNGLVHLMSNRDGEHQSPVCSKRFSSVQNLNRKKIVHGVFEFRTHAYLLEWMECYLETREQIHVKCFGRIFVLMLCSVLFLFFFHGWDFLGYSRISGFKYLSESNRNGVKVCLCFFSSFFFLYFLVYFFSDSVKE